MVISVGERLAEWVEQGDLGTAPAIPPKAGAAYVGFEASGLSVNVAAFVSDEDVGQFLSVGGLRLYFSDG